jgi:lipopolysaccharide export system protein LptA
MNETLHRFAPALPARMALARAMAGAPTVPASFASLARLAAVFAVAVPLAFAWSSAHAERADQDKPLNIEADNMTYDDLKQLTIFTGHVVATKGTILLRADHVEVKQDPQGYQYATGTSSGTNLSYFRQKRDGLNEYIEGNAIRIDYDGKQDLTTLTNRAVVRRLQGLSKIVDEVHGDVITYDGQKDFYTAQSGSGIQTGSGTGRVRAILAPRNTAQGPDNAPSTAPAAASAPSAASAVPSTASSARSAASSVPSTASPAPSTVPSSGSPPVTLSPSPDLRKDPQP